MLTAVLLLVCPSSPAVVQGPPSGWELVISSDGSVPTARHEAAYVEAGGLFYLMGGRGSRPVEVFDPVAATWTNLGLPPLSMHHYQPVEWGGKIYAVCAFEGSYPNETPVSTVQIFDPAGASWQTGVTIPAHRNRGAAGAVVHRDRIYVLGGNTQGHDGGYVPWFDCFDPATGQWTVLPDAPHARDHFTAAVIGNKLYAAGGRQTEQPNPFLNTVGPVDVYDFTAGTWSSMPEPIPTERAGTMTVARAEHLIVVGGETTSQAHGETEALDVGTGTWTALPGLLQPRHSGAAVLHQDAVYVACGSGSQGGSPELNTQERLVLGGLLDTSPLNLVTNGDLDAGLASWQVQGTLALGSEGGIAAPSLEVQLGWTGQRLAVDERETYTLTALYEVVGGPGTVELGLRYLDGGGSLLGEETTAVGTTADWTSLAMTGTTPTGTAELELRFYADGGRTLRLDDVVVTEARAETVRLGVPANPWALLPSTQGPVLGATWDPVIDHGDFVPGATLDLLGIGWTPLNLPTSLGTLLLLPSQAVLASASAGVPFAIPVPADPGLAGLALVAQGASIAGSSTPLTNALDLILQAP